MISFFIAGRPRATQTGSVITVHGRSFPIRRNTAWSTVCGLVARQHAPATPWEGPVGVSLLFVLPRPADKRRGRGKAEHVVTTRPDLGNLSKGLLDAWNGILWRDDSQVAVLHEAKVYEDDRLVVGVLVTAQELARDSGIAIVADNVQTVAEAIARGAPRPREARRRKSSPGA